ncbi:AMP-binding protein [Mycobacterium camsae]|uniref:AMP-binding protein n=1 Tax=Mycobacterium gordonae TaxID=1778 RepID=UPI00197DFA92|nr:AMP-binding protein [Mycobacterium gordonae]
MGPPEPAEFGVDSFTVAAVLDRRAEQYPDRVVLSVAGTDITVGQLRQRSCAAAKLLMENGLGTGDCVALFTATCPEWIYFWLGAARIGAVSAAINAANKGQFLRHNLELSRAKLVVADAERKHRIDEIADTRTIVVHDVSIAAALDRDASVPVVDGSETGALFFTSGTTGPSKAVATSWQYLFTVAATAAAAWELRTGEVVWTAMPLFHLSAAPSVLAPLLVGGQTVLAGAFHPSEVWDDVRAHGAVGFVGAGAMVAMLQNLPADPRDAQLPLRFISAAPIDAASYRTIENRYRCAVVTMYGMTEAFPLAVNCVSYDGVPGTSGRTNPNFEVRIVDAAGAALPAGSVGEITCRPRFGQVMSHGYVRAGDGPHVQVDSHPDWFRTGDLGKLDTDGNLTYVDRVKDSLRRRGENVSSVEVEAVVMSHPAVAEAAAVAVPSDLGEDDILIVVTLRPGAAVDCAELLDHCSARMPYFCVPRYVDTVDEIPKNAIGRVRKDLLRARGLSAAAWDRQRHGYVVSR